MTTAENETDMTDKPKFGAASRLFDGTTDYISETFPPEFDFGKGGYTVEFWLPRDLVESIQFIFRLRAKS